VAFSKALLEPFLDFAETAVKISSDQLEPPQDSCDRLREILPGRGYLIPVRLRSSTAPYFMVDAILS
jgi:hypothetical protein